MTKKIKLISKTITKEFTLERAQQILIWQEKNVISPWKLEEDCKYEFINNELRKKSNIKADRNTEERQ